LSQHIVNSFREKFNEIISGSEEKDSFNADERGLLRAMSDKTVGMTGCKCKSGRNSKKKITVLLAARATGEKLSPLVIGKANQPKYLKCQYKQFASYLESEKIYH
jgi:hypothetical protein